MTSVVVAVKFLDAIVHALPTTIGLTLGVMAAVLPTWAAAIFAVRHQSEFEAVASRSAIVVSELTELRRRIDAVSLGVPLASEHLGAAVLNVTELMMSDLGEWAVLFKVKQVETA